MAALAFFGFDLFQLGIGDYTGTSSVAFQRLCKQAGFYTAKGYDTLDQAVEGALDGQGNPSTKIGVDSGTGSWGSALGVSITGGTRTSAITAKCWQLAMVRSSFGVGAEVWVSMDFKIATLAANSFSSSFSPTADYQQMFKYGDISVRMKTVTWNASSSLFECVVSIHNVASEIATVSFPTTASTWNHIRLHVKLDATTGLVEVAINGIAQDTPYTGQNTVATTALASAVAIFFGPPVLDNGTSMLGGNVDNVYFDDAAFAPGRPTARKLALSGETATGWAATGTSVTTIRDALTSDLLNTGANNAKAARGTTIGSDVLFDVTTPTTSDLDTDVIGVQIGVGGVITRNAAAPLRLSVGVSLSGTHNMGTVAAATTLPLGQPTTPPSTNVTSGRLFLEQIWEKPAAAGPYAKTDLANIKPRLLVV